MNRLSNYFTISLSILLITASCVNSSKKDLSFTPKEYQKLGMPDYAKVWSRVEYGRALSTMKNIKLYNPLSFPRKHSKKSSGYFNRLISEENLSFLQDTALPLIDKAYQIQQFSSFQTGLIHLYTDGIKDEKHYAEELIDIYIFGLFVNKNMLDLAEKIMESDDKVNIDLKSGRSVVLQGYVNLIFKITGEQLKPNIYLAKDLDRLSGEVSQSLIENWKWIEQADREKINDQILGVIENSSSDVVKNNYQKILAAISKMDVN